ncbi:methyltransferase domain-containing protein [Fusobacterium necrophorum]|uniref:class I SAM-dependent methyltransferase n=1 Tax=Fusobacterium necrophorum TaxID=859 RepID=UPI001010C356|nr:methyltransferase domain-containing protein [Fusobacterium necrophorum]RXZ27848.1 methyltransferase domain-containing protein [Fusobacterium necrophorum]
MKEFTNIDYLEDIRKKIPGYDLMLEIIFNAILKQEFPNSNINTILSIAGQSEEIKFLQSRYSFSSLSLVEASEKMLELVKESCQNVRNFKHIHYYCQTFEEYENTTQYDLCICLLVLQFVEDPAFFLKKVYHSLLPHGTFLLSIFSNVQLEYWKEFALSRGANPEQVEKTFSQQETVMKVLSPTMIENLLQEIGFTNITKVCQILSTTLWLIKK